MKWSDISLDKPTIAMLIVAAVVSALGLLAYFCAHRVRELVWAWRDVREFEMTPPRVS
jgi:hypothetical protein